MILSLNNTSREVCEITAYGDGYSVTLPEEETGGGISVYTCPPLMIPDPEVETVARTIHIQTTGNDITGDGTSVGTAYATITKALQTINRIFGVEVIIQLGTGTFQWDSETLKLLQERTVENGSINFKGIYSTVVSGVTFAETGVKMIYNCTKSGLTVTEDELVGLKALWNVGKGRVGNISWNNAGTNTFQAEMLTSGKNGTFDLIQFDSIIELESGTDLDITFETDISSALYFTNVELKAPVDDALNLDLRKTAVYYQDSVINSPDGIIIGNWNLGTYQDLFFNRTHFKYADGSSNRLMNIRRLMGHIKFKRCFFDARNPFYSNLGIILMACKGASIEMSENCFRGNGNMPCLDGGGFDIQHDVVNSFRDVRSVITTYAGYKYYLPSNDSDFVSYFNIFNVDYIIEDYSTSAPTPEILENIKLYVQLIDDGNLVRLIRTNPLQLVNPAKDMFIKIPNIPRYAYPETETGKRVTLVNNTTTNIVVGNKIANDSIFIKYTIQRDDETETNTIQISNNGTSVSVAEGTLLGDDVGVSFLVSYDDDDIRLSVLLDDDVTGYMKYNIERTLI